MNSLSVNGRKLPFDYVVVTSSITASGTEQQTITMSSDSEFELHAFAGQSSTDLDTDFIPSNFSVQLTDQSTGRQLSDARVPQRNICPVVGTLSRLLSPVIFPRSAIVLLDFLNLDGSNANTVTFILKGYKLFGR